MHEQGRRSLESTGPGETEADPVEDRGMGEEANHAHVSDPMDNRLFQPSKTSFGRALP